MFKPCWMLNVATRNWPALTIAAAAGAGVADGAEADDPQASSAAAKHDSKDFGTAEGGARDVPGPPAARTSPALTVQQRRWSAAVSRPSIAAMSAVVENGFARNATFGVDVASAGIASL